MEEGDKIFAQSKKRFSTCVLNESNFAIRKERGFAVTDEVTAHASSNPYLATTYRKLIYSYIRDSIQKGEIGVKSNEVLVVEFGSGSGQLAYLLIRQLINNLNLLPTTPLGKISIKYILTDNSEKNINFWRENGYFKYFIDNNIVDFARFDVMHDKDIKLLSGKVLDKSTINCPVIFIANYLLNSLTNDSFIVRNNTISEQLINFIVEGRLNEISLLARALKKTKWSEKIVFPPLLYEDDEDGRYTVEDLKREEQRRVDQGEDPSKRPLPKEFECIQYYKEESDGENAHFFNDLLEYFRTNIEYDSSFLLPVGTLKFIDNLLKLSKFRFYLIMGDQGNSLLDEFSEITRPHIHLHQGGGWSFDVNFLAIKKFFEMKHEFEKLPYFSVLGGKEVKFKVNSFVSGFGEKDLSNLYSTQLEVNQFGPDNYFQIYRSLNTAAKPSTIHSLLRLSCNDPSLMFQYKNNLIQTLVKSNWEHEIIQELLRVWSNYYHLPSFSSEDIPYALGELFMICERYEDSIRFFQSSLQLNGAFVSTNYNIGICYEKMQNYEKALEYYQNCSNSKVDEGLNIDYEERINIIGKYVDELKEEEIQKEKRRKKKSENIIEIKEVKKKRVEMYQKEDHLENVNKRMSNRFSRYNKYEQPEEEEESENESDNNDSDDGSEEENSNESSNDSSNEDSNNSNENSDEDPGIGSSYLI